MHVATPTRGQILHLSHQQCTLLAPDQSLTIYVREHIVSLLADTRRVLAQCRFPRYAFRMFVVLLVAEEGADYDALYAGLYCSEACLSHLLTVGSLKIPAFQQEMARGRAYLRSLKKGVIESEMKQVRRAIKGPAGVSTILQTNGFPWNVQTAYGKGYLLVLEHTQEEVLEGQQSDLSQPGSV